MPEIPIHQYIDPERIAKEMTYPRPAPKPQYAQLVCGKRKMIARFGWFAGLDIVSIVFYDNANCHGTETMGKAEARKYWKQLLKAGYKIEEAPIELDDQLALSQAIESKE